MTKTNYFSFPQLKRGVCEKNLFIIANYLVQKNKY